MVLVYVRGFLLNLDNKDPKAVLINQSDRLDIEELCGKPIEEIPSAEIQDLVHMEVCA